MKNKNLYEFHCQLEAMKTSIIFQLLFGRIKDFYKNNDIRINSLIDKLNKLQEEYFIYNEEGKVKEEGDPKKPVMVEGKTYEEYLEKYELLMEAPCNIKF